MAKPLPTKQDIEIMRQLQQIGYSNPQIADIFNVSKSKVWDTLHDRWGKKIVVTEYRKLQVAIEVIRLRKQQGHNSLRVSQEFNIPLSEVNYIWGTIHLEESVV